jgi:hypothetical protein
MHASSFHKSYEALIKTVVAAPGGPLPDEQRIGVISHPAMVLSAFASELYLKCLLCIETDKVPEDHNLLRLFEGLKVSTRHELDDLWDTDIRRPEKQAAIEKLRALPDGDDIRLDLRYALERGADGFIELRYFYETEQVHFLLSDFPFCLRMLILRRCPYWGSVLPTPAKGLTR